MSSEIRRWEVWINGAYMTVEHADTAADAATMAGDRWRATYTQGEDRGEIEHIDVRRVELQDLQGRPSRYNLPLGNEGLTPPSDDR